MLTPTGISYALTYLDMEPRADEGDDEDDYYPISALLLIRCRDSTGKGMLMIRASEDCDWIEQAGMLTSASSIVAMTTGMSGD